MNNKGITLIEIIISIVLISIVLIFLFSLLVTVNDINYESEVNSTYLINKSLILKNIEEDFNKAENIIVNNCDIDEFFTSYPKPADSNYDEYFNNKVELTANQCLKFTYGWKTGVTETDDPGYLGIYYYKNKEDYVISYIRGKTKATRTLPDFEKVPTNLNMEWTLNGSSTLTGELNSGFYNIYIPITGTDGKDYSLNISYYKP